MTRRDALFGMTAVATAQNPQRWRMPDESEPHKRTWMAFGPSQKVWGSKLLPEVRRNLGVVAQAIAKFEPVSMLVREEDFDRATAACDGKAELIACPLDDLWIRDTGPVFVTGSKRAKAAVDFHFNGWGEKQDFDNDEEVAAFVAKQAGAPVLATKLVLEGGGIEVDGHGTAIIAESCVLNENRNPGMTKAAFTKEIGALLGLEKIIWIPGIRGRDITDGHTDFYARFARPGVVLAGFDPDPDSHDHEVTRQNIQILRAAKDAQGRALDVLVLTGPEKTRTTFASEEFAAGYIGFYVCNGAVIAQQFGDAKADAAARETLRKAFPGRQVLQLNVDRIAAGGGSIHCATQQEPA